MSLNLGALAAAPTKKAKQEKPMLPDPTGELTPLVAIAIEHKQHIEARSAAYNQVRDRLTDAAFKHVCQFFAGRDTGIEDTLQIGTATGKAMLTLSNKYKLPEDLTPIRQILGDEADSVIRESVVIQIDADAIPEMVKQGFVDELIRLAQQLDAMLGTEEGQRGPVLSAITVKTVNAIDSAFHEKRWKMLTCEQNARLHQLMPCVVSMRLDY